MVTCDRHYVLSYYTDFFSNVHFIGTYKIRHIFLDKTTASIHIIQLLN